MDKKPIAILRNVSKTYLIGMTRLRALDDVSLEIYEREFVCICGRSGSGKSTLLNMMAGLEPPSRGEIDIAGVRIEKLSEAGLVKFRLENVGFIFQQFNLFSYMDAMENVAIPLVYRGVSRTVRKKRALEALDAVGLLSHAKHKPSQMSGGQQQRVGIARALISNAPILFADEPTGNLDSKTSNEILDLIRNISKRNGYTLIMVTHDPEIAQKADRIFHLLDGKIVQVEIPDHSHDIEETAQYSIHEEELA